MRWVSWVLLLLPHLARAQSAPPRWRLVEAERYGALDGPAALTGVSAVLPGPDGRRVYVAQRPLSRISVFEVPSGRLVRTIGRNGAGPGEFQGLASLGWRRDTLYAADGTLQRLALFSPEGEHLRTERIVSRPLATTHYPAAAFALCSDGTALGRAPISVGAVAEGVLTAAPVVRMTRDGEVVGEVAMLDLRKTMFQASVGGRVLMGGRPMAERNPYGVAPDGSALVVVGQPIADEPAGTFQVTRVACTGDTLFHRAYRYGHRPIPPTLADSILDEYAKAWGPQAGSPAVRNALKEAIALPSVQPPVSDVVVGADGTTWLRREDTGGAFVGWTVLGPAGRILANLAAPAEVRLLAVDGESAWGVVKDEVDVPYVVRHRVVRTP